MLTVDTYGQTELTQRNCVCTHGIMRQQATFYLQLW